MRYLLDAYGRIHVSESKERLPRAARHELQKVGLFCRGERPQCVPKPLHDRLGIMVATTVACEVSKIIDIDSALLPSDNHLQLTCIEHADPVDVYEIVEAT